MILYRPQFFKNKLILTNNENQKSLFLKIIASNNSPIPFHILILEATTTRKISLKKGEPETTCNSASPFYPKT